MLNGYFNTNRKVFFPGVSMLKLQKSSLAAIHGMIRIKELHEKCNKC